MARSAGSAALFACFCLLHSYEPSLASQTPPGTWYRTKGTFTLGAILTVHTNHGQYGACEELDEYAVLMSAAVDFALEHYNGPDGALGKRNLSLGLWAQDNCYSPQWSILEMLRYVPSEDSAGSCHSGDDDKDSQSPNAPPVFSFTQLPVSPAKDHENINDTNVVGVVGQFTSQGAISGTSVLEYFCLPLVSVDSTSSDLDRETLFPYFMRTVPSDHYQGAVLAAVMNHFRWHDVVVVYQDSIYGRTLKEGFFSYVKAHKDNICVADKFDTTIAVGVVDKERQWNATMAKLRTLAEKKDFHRALLIADVPTARQFFQNIAKQPDLYQMYQFIGPDGWSSSAAVVAGLEEAVNGSIVIEGLAKSTTGFREYLQKRNMANTVNPWLRQLIAQQNGCCEGADPCPQGREGCANSTGLTSFDMEGENRAHFIVEAVAILAEAVASLCGDVGAECQVTGPRLRDIMRNSSVQSPIADFAFYNGSNSGNPEYSLYQFQVTDAKPNGSWVAIADCDYRSDILPLINVNRSALMSAPFLGNETGCDQQVCSVGFGRSAAAEEEKPTCCLVCERCLRYQFAETQTSLCTDCPEGLVADLGTNRTSCVKDTILYMSWSEELTLSSLALSGVGMVLCWVSAFLVIRHRSSSAVTSSGLYFNLAFLATTLVEFALPLAYVWEPTPGLCVVQWSLSTLNWTAFFATLTVRSLYLKEVEKAIEEELALQTSVEPETPKRTPFRHVSVPALLPKCSAEHDLKARFSFCLAVQVLILVLWAFLETPTVEPHRASDHFTYAQCSNLRDLKSLVGALWPAVLTLVGIWSSWRIMSSSVLFTRRLGRLSFISCAAMLIVHCVYASLVLDVTRRDVPPVRVGLEQFHAALVAMIFLATQTLPMLFFLAFRRYKSGKVVKSFENTPEYMRRINTGPQRRGMFIVDIYSLADALRRSSNE